MNQFRTLVSPCMVLYLAFTLIGCSGPALDTHEIDADVETDVDTDDGDRDGDNEDDSDQFYDGDDNECHDGCLIDGICYASRESPPENPCLICDPSNSGETWTDNDGADCDDQLYCNGWDRCSAGECSLHSGSPCPSDGIFCNGIEICNEDSDSCSNEGNPCNEKELCFEEERLCCEPESSLGCNDDLDVTWFDSCGHVGAVVEECRHGLHFTCEDGMCLCEPGWTGDDCDQCVVYVNGSTGNDENEGSSWASALATVGSGLLRASEGNCEVWVVEGTYFPTSGTDRNSTFQLVSGVGLYGGFSGDETQRDQRDFELNITTLSGDIGVEGDYSDNAFHVVTGADDAIIDGFTITSGNANDVEENSGGGMLNNAVSPTISNCTFSGNMADLFGGGMYNNGASPTITNCTFSGNSARAGGGMYNIESSTTVNDSTFSLNTANRGGGMYNRESPATITDCIFSGNLGHYSGGGMDNDRSSPTVHGCTFSNNETSGYSFGGGMYNDESSPIVTNCTFSNNTASFGGGGIQNIWGSPTILNCIFSENVSIFGAGINNGSSSPIISHCIFTGNIADHTGGGIDNYESDVTIINCTFSENTADSGGGIFNSDSSTFVNNCTFSGNSARYGGGIFSTWSFAAIVSNSIFWENTAPNGPQIYTNRHYFLPAVYSNVQGGYAGEGNIDEDPLFVGSDDLRLQESSPCIDAGDHSSEPPSLLDLDGNPRLVDGDEDGIEIIDMGAYEFDPAAD